MSSLYDCCCCDPCRYIRPNVESSIDKPVPDHYCCRCVPRGIMLVFTPVDTQDDCCAKVTLPMLHTLGTDNYLSIYAGSLFGVDVRIELGRDGYDGICVWRILATTTYSQVLIDEQFVVNHEEVNCLSPPFGFSALIDGPEGCTGGGLLSLDEYAKARLPFLREEEDPYHENFQGLYPPCGECAQVCSDLCVRGTRHENGPFEQVVFHWFEDADTGDRGWRYQAPGNDWSETLYLTENEYGECVLAPDLEESGPEVFEEMVIDLERGCSCEIHEIFAVPFVVTHLAFSVRCGVCTCWGWWCGSCRCLPRELCVLIISDMTAQRVVIVWDEENERWGDDHDPVRLLLPAGGNNGNCEITADVTGFYPIPTTHKFNCRPPEAATGIFDPQHDSLSLTLVDESQRLSVIASSLKPDCALGVCDEATPCYKKCGSHPPSVIVSIRMWELQEDVSGYQYPLCEVTQEVELHYWETVEIDGGVLRYNCGYIGYWDSADEKCCPIKMELRAGQITFGTPAELSEGCQETGGFSYDLVTEECSPYYAETGVLEGALPWSGLAICAGCEADSGTFARFSMTVTE